jgi:regulator of nucleoside diphosphate kinase
MMRSTQYTIKHASTHAYRSIAGKGFLGRLYRFFTDPGGRSLHVRRFLRRVLGQQSHILLSENDYYRLLAMLTAERKKGITKRSQRARLRYLLRKIDLRPIKLVPRDVITMNSRFFVSSKQGAVFELRLVYPDAANKSEGRISILSWLGMCLLGKRKGDRIGNRLVVGEIFYQPEASNHFHL